MSFTQSTFAEILSAASPPGLKGLYFIGTFDRRITFFSQQVRALRLARAMAAENVVQGEAHVAVIGAGAAGVTIASALALQGKRVTLYDPAAVILHLQSASARLLHPHIYEWPRLGSLDDQAGLPILDWKSNSGGSVCDTIKSDFDTLLYKLGPRFQFEKAHKLVGLEAEHDEWRLTFLHAGDNVSRVHKHVILAMGFGEERSCGVAKPSDYWKPTGTGTAAAEAVAGATYLVSGNGDGALTELLGLLIENFEHVSFTREFLDLAKGDRLPSVVRSIFSATAPDADVGPELSARVRPLLEERGVLTYLRRRLRSDRVVTLNSRTALFGAGRAAQLNQCMTYSVLEAAILEGRAVALTSGEITDVTLAGGGMIVTGIADASGPVTNAFDHVILRHGPDKTARYGPALNAFEVFKAHVDATIAAGTSFEIPELASGTYDFFRAHWIDKIIDQANKDAAREGLASERDMLLIGHDRVCDTAAEWGSRTLAEVADQCERLPKLVVVQLDLPPAKLPESRDLIRIASASKGRIELRATAAHLAAWQALDGGIIADAQLLPRFRPRPLSSSGVKYAVDRCLVRQLNQCITKAVQDGGAPPIGVINDGLLAYISNRWTEWRAVLDGEPALRFDFLRWLANVIQESETPWDGSHAQCPNMGNALIMILAADLGESLVPARMPNGNLGFAKGSPALGSACESIGIESVASRQSPADWNVDALILSGVGDLELLDSGLILDGGTPGLGMQTARRVRPAVIQRSPYWRQKMRAGLAEWKTAVEGEFAEFRKRQDDGLTEFNP